MSSLTLHLGSHKNLSTNELTLNRLFMYLSEILTLFLNKYPNTKVKILLENTANNKYIGTLKELNWLIQKLYVSFPKNIGICLDTCHLFSESVDLNNLQHQKSNLEYLIKTNLISRIELIHLNNSKFQFLSNKDRHENLDLGHIMLDNLQSYFSSLIKIFKLKN